MMEPSSIRDVAVAIAAFAKRSDAKVYIERRGDGYRWSPAHPGGPYPILREVARFLELDHHRLIVGCAAVDDLSVVAPEGPRMPKAVASVVVKSPRDKSAVARALKMLADDAQP